MHLPSPSDSLSRARALSLSLSLSLSNPHFLYLSSHAVLRWILDRPRGRLNPTLNKFKQVVRFGWSWRTMISHVVLWVCFKNRPNLPWVLKRIGPGCLRRPCATGLFCAHCKTDLGVQTRRSCLRWYNVRGRRSLWHPQVSQH
jgi:hypothetical protein